MKEGFWYPQKALGEADRLAPVPPPSAAKRQHPKSQPIRFEPPLVPQDYISKAKQCKVLGVGNEAQEHFLEQTFGK